MPLILLAFAGCFLGLTAFAPPNALAQDRLTLDQFLAQVRDANLDLKIESAKLDASQANARGARIPPPMVGYMRMTDQSGSSAGGFEVNQMLPFPTKLIYDYSARGFEADAQAASREAKNAETVSQARLVFLKLWGSQRRIHLLKEKREAIEGHLKLARAGARSDSFLRIHLLKAEQDLDLLENDLLSAEQGERENAAAAAEAITADPTSFRPLLEEPPLTQAPLAAATPSPVKAAKLGFEAAQARQSEARSAWLPDLFFRYKRQEQTQMMPRTSEMMIGVNLPFLFPWDPAANSAKASAMRAQSEWELASVERKVGAEKNVLATRATSLRKQLGNIEEKLLPRAEKRMKLVHNLAPRDMETLQDHRETMEAFPDLKLKALDLRLQYEEAVAELSKLEGEQR